MNLTIHDPSVARRPSVAPRTASRVDAEKRKSAKGIKRVCLSTTRFIPDARSFATAEPTIRRGKFTYTGKETFPRSFVRSLARSASSVRVVSPARARASPGVGIATEKVRLVYHVYMSIQYQVFDFW